MPPSLTLNLLGTPAAQFDGKPFILSAKPLVLLSLLAFQSFPGTPTTRDELAAWLWTDTSNPLANLSVTLNLFRKVLGAESIASNERNRTLALNIEVHCDALMLLTAFETASYDQVNALYGGAFFDGLSERAVGDQAWAWIEQMRFDLALKTRSALLFQAEREATVGQFVIAGAKAERAYRLPGAPDLDDTQVQRFHLLFCAADHPLRTRLEQDAFDSDLELERGLKSDQAQQVLFNPLVGRTRELQKLAALKRGQWAWIRGGTGTGKTALLRSLELRTQGQYLPAHAGVPYGTLEPLLRFDGPEPWFTQQQERSDGWWLIDDWERIDEGSRNLLRRLHGMDHSVRVLITAQSEPPFKVDALIELNPLKAEDLTSFEGMYEATDGLPWLVAATLRGETPSGALGQRLIDLPDLWRTIYFSLALLETPDLELVQRALNISGRDVVQAQSALISAGLIEPSGRVQARQVALESLARTPELEADLSLSLARLLEGMDAVPLYQRSRHIWSETDHARIYKVYLLWGKESLRRGFPQLVADALEEAPRGPEMTYLRGRALERAGQFKQARTVIEDLLETLQEHDQQLRPKVLALKGAVLQSLGEHEAAEVAAKEALKGPDEARAEALMTLGRLAMMPEPPKTKEADEYFSRAAVLWRVLGEQAKQVDALNNRAVARSMAEGHDETGFQMALDAAGDHLPSHALVLINMGRGLSFQGRFEDAAKAAQEAYEAAYASGSWSRATIALHNLAAEFEHLGKHQQAIDSYETCRALAEKQENSQYVGRCMVQIGRLERNEAVFNEGMNYLERRGFAEIATHIRMFSPFTAGSDPPTISEQKENHLPKQRENSSH
jgi:tetratricopeptide (TPR) repeat protein